MKILLLLLATTGTVLGCYLPPAEGVFLFRRDTLPIDSNRQILLSRDLTTLATQPTTMDTAENRRATAQLLALAANFDPSSKGPAALNAVFAKPDHNPEAFATYEFEGALNNISKTIDFLLTKPNNKKNLEIAQLLIDPFVHISPDLDFIAARPYAKESARWRGVVAPLASLQQKIPEPAPPIPAPSIPEKMPEEDSQENEAEKNNPTFAFDEKKFNGSLFVPVFVGFQKEGQPNRASKETLLPLTVQSELSHQKANSPELNFSDQELSQKISQLVKANVTRRHGNELANHFRGKASFSKAIYEKRNHLNIALPIAILCEGLFTEDAPVDKLCILGNLEASGQIKEPRYASQLIEILSKSGTQQPRRLIVSSKLVPYFESLLIQQKEDFFFHYDVFAVETLDEAIALSFPSAHPEQTKAALEKFAEIRRVGKDKATSVFAANPHVLSRLAEVQKLEPRYLSASLLYLRGSNKQPSNHSSLVLASLIQSALFPLSKVPYNSNPDNLQVKALENIHKKCRANLDPIEKKVALKDREIYREALDLSNQIRSMARLKTRHEKEADWAKKQEHLSLLRETFKSAQSDYYQLATELSVILGEAAPPNPNSKT